MISIKKQIISDIKSAKKSIKIAVSWLTDKDFLSALLDKKKADTAIEISIVLSAHKDNRREDIKQKLIELIVLGSKVGVWGNEDSKTGNFMHCKFYIIDDIFAKSGSYNWTQNAEKNMECMDIVNVKEKISFYALLLNKVRTYAII